MWLPMVEVDYPIRFNVSQIGHIARDVITAGGRARAGAVFENSWYIETPGSWVCIVGLSTAIGPLTLRCDTPPQIDWRRSGVRLGMAVHVDEAAIYVNPVFYFSLSAASIWTPSTAGYWTPESLHRGLDCLVSWTRKNYQPDEGLGCTISSSSNGLSAVAKRAMASIRHLQHWLCSVIPEQHNLGEAPPRTVNQLIGLGPGLTPSGDDYLGGVMIALHLVGRGAIGKQLYGAIADKQAEASNAISSCHLSAAARGSCNASIHAALNAILTGDIQSLPSALKKIDQIGHTSGWDSLAGAVTALTICLRGSSTAS